MPEETALATLEKTTEELMAQGGLGVEDVFITPEKIELVQRTTTLPGAMPGKFFDVLNEVNFDELTVIPLQIRRKRVLFPTGGALGQKPLCRSDDGIRPSEFVEFPQSDLCKNCPKGSWENYDPKTGQGKPTCKEKYEWLLILKDSGLPRRLTVGATSIQATKTLLKRLKEDIVMSKAKGESVNLFDYHFTVKSTLVNGEKGTFYVVRYTDVKRVHNLGEYGPLYKQYVLSARARQMEREQEQAAAQDMEQAIPSDTDNNNSTVTI